MKVAVGRSPESGAPLASDVRCVVTSLKHFYRRRHKIGYYFCRIKDWLRIATRYDKLARNFLASAALIGALYWIKLWVQTLEAPGAVRAESSSGNFDHSFEFRLSDGKRK